MMALGRFKAKRPLARTLFPFIVPDLLVAKLKLTNPSKVF